MRERERETCLPTQEGKKHAKRQFSKANIADQLQDCIRSNDCGRFAAPLFKGEQRPKRSHTSKHHPGGAVKMRWLFVEFESKGFIPGCTHQNSEMRTNLSSSDSDYPPSIIGEHRHVEDETFKCGD